VVFTPNTFEQKPSAYSLMKQRSYPWIMRETLDPKGKASTDTQTERWILQEWWFGKDYNWAIYYKSLT